MKKTSANAELMFNNELVQYQIFIENPPAESAFQKTFLLCKIKNESVFKITLGLTYQVRPSMRFNFYSCGAC